ncbi:MULTISPECIES: hypothetical protein [Planktothrix]|uniref:Uncharacterized protein n=1 Tax=Planktothrix mougeotii LEGE 06226 TaxID=1828728 RepID=A0ABR9UE89_9CYAN|nr:MULTISPECIES: hypothetical protein [Planktothrix]MBD2481667.1 hypothetical protein [Planktothrix sp. FACHB-1365]MBE9144783.1 hypothetical protein [Planktothrix mougeotii LEGE 06226]
MKPNRSKSIIPDPQDWITEHYVLASFAHTLSTLKHLLGDEETQADPEISYTHEGELVIGTETINLLKESYGDDHWRYLETYLSACKF